MGIKHFFHEIKAKVSHHRLFKGLVTDSHKVLPKCMPHAIKSVDIIKGDAIVPGCVTQTTFVDGSKFKCTIDAIDMEKHTCKYTVIEGDVLGDKLEKICYEVKFEATPDGGAAVTVKAEYHVKGDYEVSDDVLKAADEQNMQIYKACEEYLAAHPDVCA